MIEVLLVGAGGFAGAVLRFLACKWWNIRWTAKTVTLPLGTFTANIVACFVLGIVSGSVLDPMAVLFFTTGFTASLSTFSTLVMESKTIGMVTRFWSAIYVAGSFVAGTCVYLLGMFIASASQA
jgi:CrcB protein